MPMPGKMPSTKFAQECREIEGARQNPGSSWFFGTEEQGITSNLLSKLSGFLGFSEN